MKFIVQPGYQSKNLQGQLRVPGDKSISHRSIMFGAIAEGVSHISGFLDGEDSLNTLRVFRSMGVNIDGPDNGQVTIHGVGMQGLQQPAQSLNVGNSGTSMRLLAGLLAGQTFNTELCGDASLSKRPMQRVTQPLTEMGAVIETAEKGRPPLKITGGQCLQPIQYILPMASAQVKSCCLLAGLYANGQTCITEPVTTRDHTERMLKAFGWPVNIIRHEQGLTVCVQGSATLQATDIDVPADISSAAFFMVGASIAAGSDILLEHVGVNPTRIGIINILQLMGADLSLLNEREVGGEPVADIRVRSARLKGIHVPEALVPLAIDEFPVLFIAAACAEGETRITGAEELRVKESDRIQVMADGLQTLGVEVTATADGMIIQGQPDVAAFHAGRVYSHDDHRIAMAFTVASLCSDGKIEIENCDNVATSFPAFANLAGTAGIDIQVIDE